MVCRGAYVSAWVLCRSVCARKRSQGLPVFDVCARHASEMLYARAHDCGARVFERAHTHTDMCVVRRAWEQTPTLLVCVDAGPCVYVRMCVCVSARERIIEHIYYKMNISAFRARVSGVLRARTRSDVGVSKAPKVHSSARVAQWLNWIRARVAFAINCIYSLPYIVYTYMLPWTPVFSLTSTPSYAFNS